MLKIVLTNKFKNLSMKNGNKNISEKLLFKILKELNTNFEKNTTLIFKNFIVKQAIFVNVYKKKKSKTVTYEIPFLVKSSLRIFYALKKIIKTAKTLSKPFFLFFKEELHNTFKQKGEMFKQKEDLYKYVFSKKSFSHYRWF